jgi:hypothetical protein
MKYFAIHLARPCAVPPHDAAGSPQIDIMVRVTDRTLGTDYALQGAIEGSIENNAALACDRDHLLPGDHACVTDHDGARTDR